MEESASSVHRAVAILLALGESEEVLHRGGLGVVEIARAVGREKSQVSRTLKALAESGLVDRDQDSLGYRLGWRFFTLAAQAGEQQLLLNAPAIMRGLVRTMGERVHLSVLEGGEVLTLLSENPHRSVQTASLASRAVPLHCTSCGRALLFDTNDEDIGELLSGVDLASRGSKSPRSVGDLIRRIRRASGDGYVVCVDEFEEGLAAVAAPVRDFRGRIVAAINISAPKFRMTGKLPLAGRQVKGAADYLSRNLGWTESQPAVTKSTNSVPLTKVKRRSK